MMYKGYQVNLEFRTFYKRNKRNGMEGWMEVMFKYQKWRLKKFYMRVLLKTGVKKTLL